MGGGALPYQNGVDTDQALFSILQENSSLLRDGNAVKSNFVTVLKRSTLKGKNLLPLGANSFL